MTFVLLTIDKVYATGGIFEIKIFSKYGRKKVYFNTTPPYCYHEMLFDI